MNKILLYLSGSIALIKRPVKLAAFIFFLLLAGISTYAQKELRNPDVIIGQLMKVIPSLKDYKAPEGFVPKITRDKNGIIGVKEELEGPELTYYGSKDKGDPVVQRTFANKQNLKNTQAPAPVPTAPSVITQNFDGLSVGGLTPADPSICAGPTAIIQSINGPSGTAIKIWDRNGSVLLGQTVLSTLVAGSGYAGQGDPVVLYDQLADRFILTEFGNIGGGNPNTLIAFVSQTNNPLGAWYVYKFQVAFFPDYPKWSVWPNAYYAMSNDFNPGYVGSSIWAFNKTKMLAGDATAEAQRFRVLTGSNGSTGCLPVNAVGTTPPPAGAPGMFIYYNDNDFTADPNDMDSLGIITFQPNFAVPGNTVVTFAQSMVTAPFLSGVTNPPSPTSGTYGALSDRLMFNANYRNFGSYEAIVLDHTVDANFGVGGGAKAGVRWYELRRTSSNWSINQQSTYAPDADWRWMGSININSKGQIALGFNLSSTTKYASILFTGRNASDAANTMGVQEQMIKAGTAYGTFANRWGDYNSVVTDVVNDSLFWMTAMYGSGASSWSTRIAQFKIGDCDVLRSDFNMTQAAPAVPELQNIVYTNTVNNTGCVAMANFLLTDTLPANVTFVSATNGGTYNGGNRVVSWPVNIAAGASQNYVLTVTINAGSYFAPITLLNEPIAAAGIPAGWTATSAVGPSNWVSSTAQSHSAPNSLFGVDNATAITDFSVATTTPLALVSPQPLNLTFWHNFSTEPTWDGGVVEISTNGGTTWTDLGPVMTANGYNGTLNPAGTNPIRGRNAFTGGSGGWIQTRANLQSYAGQNALFRFRMTSDDNTAAVGWYVDDINISAIAHVDMRTNLFNPALVRISFKDTVTLILPVGPACSPSITQQPTDVTTCDNTSVSFTCIGTAQGGVTYQWQLSTAGAGGPWNNLANGAPYSGVTTSTLTVNPAVVAMNGYQYRCVVTGTCNPTNTSNPAILTVVAASIGGTVNPPNTPVCGTTNSGTLTLSGHTGSVIRWESATILAGPYTAIANTTTTLTFTNLTQTTYFRAVVQVPGCTAVNSSVATVTFTAAGPLVIVADPGSTICKGDPTLLTVYEGSQSPIGTLYNQTGAQVNGSPSQVFEPAFAAFTSQSADDFTVPAGTSWTVTRVTANGIGTGNPTSVNVFFYNNSGSNLPGTAVATFNNVSTFVRTGGNYNVTLPASVVLIPGTYWVSIQVNMAFAGNGQWFWGNFGTTNIGNQYAWQNPGGGFGTPCTNWGYGATGCGVGGGVARNNIFSIVGSSLIVIGPVVPPGSTYLWSPAAGLSSTTTNPVAASPMTTTTYTVNVNDGAGCVRQTNITITVNERPTITTQPVNRTNCDGTTAIFTVTATGTAVTYQWQVSTDGGLTYSNLLNAAPYSGVTTPTLTINPVTVAMNNNRYRCVLTGSCSPIGTNNISVGAILTVNPLPVVTVTPTSGCGGVAGMFGTLLTASGADSYTWAPLTGLFTDAAATIPYTGGNAATVYAAPTVFTAYTVTGTLSNTTGCSNTATTLIQYTPPPPTVTPASVTMCLGDPAVRLTSSSSTSTPVQFCSGPISVIVPDATPSGAISNITVFGIPASCNISNMSVTWNMNHTWDGDMVFALKAPNGNILNLDYLLSITGGTGPTTGFVNTTVSSAGTAALSSGSNPYTGTFKADAVITNVNAGAGGPTGYTPTGTTWTQLYSVPNGTWTLAMKDGFAGDQGTLTSWCLNITYVCGVPATPATWSPVGGLFTDPAATNAYSGTPTDTVYTKPTPAGVYNYQATVQSLSIPPTTIATNHTSGNGNYVITFNFRNNNPFTVNITDIASLAFAGGASNVSAWYNTTNISGSPGPITNANNWIQFGSAAITAIGGSTVQPFMSGLSLPIPANQTYRILVSCQTAGGGFNMGYMTLGAGVNTFSAGGCDIITGTLIGYGGPQIPGVPANTPRGFVGNVRFAANSTVCTSPARNIVVTVNQPTTVVTQPVKQVICTDKVATFTVAAGGSGPFSYQWQESTNNGNTYTNITNGGVYSGATTATLTITAPPVTMSGNFYRCIITGAAPCAPAISFQVTLTVNPLPTIFIAPIFTKLLPGMTVTLTSTVTPNAAAPNGYEWLRNGLPAPNANNNSATLNVTVDNLGAYTLRVTDVNGCTSVSNTAIVSDSASGKCFIYPNPTSGLFEVRYYSVANNVLPRSLTVYDSKGDRVFTKFYTIGRPYDRMAVDMRAYGKGLYWVEIGDLNGNRITMCRVVIQ